MGLSIFPRIGLELAGSTFILGWWHSRIMDGMLQGLEDALDWDVVSWSGLDLGFLDDEIGWIGFASTGWARLGIWIVC